MRSIRYQARGSTGACPQRGEGLVGEPKTVLSRANEVLATMEASNLGPGDRPKLARSRKKKEESPKQLTLFDLLEEDGKI